MKNKKGISDVIIMSIFFFVLVVSVIMGIHIYNLIREKLVTNPTIGNDTFAVNALNQGIGTTVNMADWICFVVFFAIVIGIIITSFMFYSHPVFIVVYFILMIAGVMGGVFMSNIYNSLILSTQFSSTAIDLFPKTNYIMNNYPFILLFVFIISIIIIYSKNPYIK